MTQPPSLPPRGDDPRTPRADDPRMPQVWDTRIEDRTPSSPPSPSSQSSSPSPSPQPQPGAPAPHGGRSFADAATAPPGFGPAPQPFGPVSATPDAAAGGPAGGGSTKRRKVLAIGLGLLLVACAGTGGWLLWGRGGNDSAPKKKTTAGPIDAKLDWMAPVPDKDKEHADSFPSPWFTKDTIVLATRYAVTAYSRESGKQSWTLPVGGRVCSTSTGSDGGVAAVVWGKGDYDCDKLMAVDVEHGRQLWSQDVVDSKGRTQGRDLANISVDHGNVTLADVVGDPYVYAARTGKQSKATDYGCQQLGSVVKGSGQLTLAQCQPIYGRQFILNVDPKSGQEKWTWKVLNGIAVQNVISVSPAVLVVGRENETSASDIVTLDDKGRMGPLISVSAGPYNLDACRPRHLDSCRRVVTDDRTLYLATNKDKDGLNSIAAIDLATGKPRWTAPLGGTRTNRPLAMHEGRLLVYQEATKEEGGKLLSVDPATGDSRVFMNLPQESAERELSLARDGSAYFRDGRFYIVSDIGMTDSMMIMAFH
ncbi:PQQ-binding-like beta-propeller repeat protein [Streptomyces sp. C36]|uniref:outer membrane protein assembly factor BamB family protein n=1 Tax=Streptomyces sp. C36 TaxID=3237122 RepID=UPI0034C642F2